MDINYIIQNMYVHICIIIHKSRLALVTNNVRTVSYTLHLMVTGLHKYIGSVILQVRNS